MRHIIIIFIHVLHDSEWVTRCNMGHTLQHGSHVATCVTRCNMGHTLQHGSYVATWITRCNMGHTLQHGSHPRDTVLQDTLCFKARKGRGVCYGSGCSIWVTYVTTWVTPRRTCFTVRYGSQEKTRWATHSKHRFPAPSSKLCQNWLRH